jgi:hypothetical protein
VFSRLKSFFNYSTRYNLCFPVFLLTEAFSKTGIVASHGRRFLAILLLLKDVSTLILLFPYAYRNIPMIFSSLVMLVSTTCLHGFCQHCYTTGADSRLHKQSLNIGAIMNREG